MADFPMRTHADFGTSEPWVARTWISITRIREFVYFAEEREAFDRLHTAIIENLHECFNAMRLLHKIIAERQAKVGSQEIFRLQGPLLDITENIDFPMNQALKDFFIKGNIALNHLSPLAKFIGYQIHFINDKNDAEFERKAEKLISKSPEATPLISVLRAHRNSWHKAFLSLRGAIEHEPLLRLRVNYIREQNNVRAEFPLINGMPIVDITRKLWEFLYTFVEDILAVLLSQKLPSLVTLRQIPKEQRDPTMPIKYEVMFNVSLVQPPNATPPEI
jgi:hypothetical protein